MTTRELLAAAVKEAHATTVGYINKSWKIPPPGSHWSAFDKLVAELDAALASAGPPLPSPPFASRSTLAIWRLTPGTISGVTNLGRYGLIVVPAPDRTRLATMRAQAPQAKILCYRNAGFATTYTHGPDGNAGVTWEQATANGWLLKNSSGQDVPSGHYSGIYLADVGAPGYRQQWLTNASSWAKADGFDGVFMDDVNPNIDWHLNGQPYPVKYPNRDAYSAAVGGFLSVVGPGLKQAGLAAVPNIGASWDQPGVWGPWATHCSGALREHFMNGVPPYKGIDWQIHAKVMRDVLAVGRPFYTLTYGDLGDMANQMYVRASFLLFHDPALLSSFAWDTSDRNSSVDPYAPGWTLDLGRPLGAASSSGGIWARQFEQGGITVDTNAGTARTSKLPS